MSTVIIFIAWRIEYLWWLLHLSDARFFVCISLVNLGLGLSCTSTSIDVL